MGAFGAARGAGIAVARALLVTVTMAVLMMLMALGFIYIMPQISEDPGTWLPVSIAIALVIFAISFVAAAVLMDRAGTGQVQSLVAGGVVALCITALILTIYSGVKLVSDGGLNDLDMETLLIGFAMALIASVIIDRLVLKI